MTSLSVIVSRGTTNNFVQVLTLLMAAVHSEWAVRVLFRDESIFRVTRDGIGQTRLSELYEAQAEAYLQRLKKHDLQDLHLLLQQIKQSGDVKLYACSSSLALAGVKKEELISEIDEVRGLTAFLLEDVAHTDRVLTF